VVLRWEAGEEGGKLGVHARLLDGFDAARTEVRLLDNRE
jgi:hypothetical protein